MVEYQDDEFGRADKSHRLQGLRLLHGVTCETSKRDQDAGISQWCCLLGLGRFGQVGVVETVGVGEGGALGVVGATLTYTHWFNHNIASQETGAVHRIQPRAASNAIQDRLGVRLPKVWLHQGRLFSSS